MIETVVVVSFTVALVAMLAAAVYRERDLLKALADRVTEVERRLDNRRAILDNIGHRLWQLEHPEMGATTTAMTAATNGTTVAGSTVSDWWVATPMPGFIPEPTPVPAPSKSAPRKRKAAPRGKRRKGAA